MNRIARKARSTRALLAALALGVLTMALAPSRAAAQLSTGELVPAEGGQGFAGSRVTAELGFYTSSGTETVNVFTPAVHGRVRVATLSPELALGVDFGMRAIGVEGSPWDGDGFHFSNAYVGAHGAFERPSFRLRAALGVGIPVLPSYGGEYSAVIASRALAVLWGGWDVLYAEMGYVPFVLRFDGEWRSERFFVGGEAALALFAANDDDLARYYGHHVAAQLAVYGGVRLDGFVAGLRAQAVYLDGGLAYEDPDQGQLALVPFVRGEFGPAFAELRLLMNLDAPYGFAFDPGGGWSLNALGGVTF